MWFEEQKAGQSKGIVLFLCVGIFLIFTGALYFKYSEFGYADWDLAFFSQALWNLIHGQQYSSLFDKTFFGNHANLVAYLFVPVYKFFPCPFLLIAVKTLFFVLAAYLLYAMAKPYVGKAAVFFMLLYAFYPPNLYGLLYEFDFESLAPVIIFALIHCFEKEKWAHFFLLSIVLICVKENLPLVIMAFGILGFFTKKDKWCWGLLPLCLGGISFYILTSVVVPFFNDGNVHHAHPYIGNYSNYGKNFPDIIKAVLIHPQRIFSLFTDPFRIQWLKSIFEPLCFIPLLSPSMMLLALPILAQHFLSSNNAEQSINYSYVMTIAPFIFWGAVRVLAKGRVIVPKIYLGLLFAIGVFSALNLCSEWPSIVYRIYPTGSALTAHLTGFKSTMLKEIPSHSSVVATFNFLPELSLRPNAYAFYRIYGQNLNYENPWSVRNNTPKDVEYAYIDFLDRSLSMPLEENFQYSQARIYDFFRSDWSVKDAVENVVLFERKKDSLRLVEVSHEPFLTSAPALNARIDRKFTLMSVAKGVALNQNDSILPLTFYWKADEDTNANYAVKIQVKQGGRTILKRILRIGYAIYPTKAWQNNDHIKEHCWLYVPGVDLDRAQLVLDFWIIPGPGQDVRQAVVEDLDNAVINNAQQIEIAVKDLQ